VTRLVGVEIRRLLSRRVLRVLALLVLVGLLAVMAKTAYDSRPPTPAEIVAAEAAAKAQAPSPPELHQMQEDCRRAQAEAHAQGRSEDFGCDKIGPPRAEEFLPNRIFAFAQQMPGTLTALAAVLGLIGFLVGASFVGAEWSAGTMAHLLVWEPRRLRVLLAKTFALALVLVGLGITVTALSLGGHYLVAATRGELTGTTSGLWQSLGLRAARVSALGGFAALAGAAIAGALRNTSAALGAAFAYFLAGELAIRAAWAKSEAWLLSSNLAAWVQNGVRIPRVECPQFGGECKETVLQVSLAEGTMFLGVLVAVLLAVFAVTFHRRDVT